MNYITITYLSYLLLTLSMTIWVARTLHKNGRIFLVDSFGGNEPLADSVNHLLVVGFYLVNIGYIALALKVGAVVESTRDVFEIVSNKVGIVLLVLGAMHFFNLLVFTKMRKRALLHQAPPPVPPQANLSQVKI
ncbi:MAG: hypothetical protein ABIT76_14255 [Chthoniobacterales bacterium]